MEGSWLDESVDENLQFNLLSSDDVEAMLDHLSSRTKAVISGGKKLFLDYNRSCPSASAAAAAPAAPAQLVRAQLQQLHASSSARLSTTEQSTRLSFSFPASSFSLL